jgi:hypothetical protein
MFRKKGMITTRWLYRGLPLGGILLASIFPLSRISRQFLILGVLVWIQVFFVIDVRLPRKGKQ